MPAQNTKPTATKKVRGRPFKKGQSGNPGGRPKAAVDVRELARAHAPDAIKALVEALKDPKTKVAAATAILDRGYGKPVQAVEGTEGPAIKVSVEDARNELERLITRFAPSSDETEDIIEP